MSENKKVLIIGSGIAGISVAYHLIQKGVDVTVLDNNKNDCSIIAGALITPVVFRRMNKSWRVDEFMPYIKEFYPAFNIFTDGQVLKELSLRRMFSSEQEHDFWDKRSKQEEYQEYLTPLSTEDMSFNVVKNDFGSGMLKNAFVVQTSLLMDAAEKMIEQHGNFISEGFDYNQLKETSYNDVKYSDIIFCEGHHVSNNPWFNYLPVNKTKGELLTVKATSLPENISINRKCFMLPLGNQLFKVGSTYSWHDDSTNPTEEGQKEILEKLTYLIDEQVEIVDHIAGVRPTTKDRRPWIGTHPDYPHYHIFNGLGTKGFLLAPLLAKEFVDYLLHGEELHPEVCLTRIIN